MGTSAGFSMAAALLAWLLRFMLVRENKRLAQRPDHDGTRYVY